MTPLPDIAGFIDAQNRLVRDLGQIITFRIPQTPEYPPGTRLDPDSGRPYDPTIQPSTGTGYTETPVRCTVVYDPIFMGRGGDDVTEGPSGVRRDENMALILLPVDHLQVSTATHFLVNGISYKITEMMPDGLQGIERWIVYGEAR